MYNRPSSLHRYLYTSDSGSGSGSGFGSSGQQQRAWALVTGSSSGIGKCLTFELASHGFNVVLHGRNRAKLEGVRKELQAMYPRVETKILVADAAQCHRETDDFFEDIKAQLKDLHLTVLINCAGAGPSPSFGELEDYSAEEILENLHLNAGFPALLTAAVLPIMKGRYRERRGTKNVNEKGTMDMANGQSGTIPKPRVKQKQKRPILVINIGSVTDEGFPMVSFYSAGKAATHALHKALALEAALDYDDNEVEIEIISHRVGHATGVSHSGAPPTLFQPHARTIARAVLARTGCGRKSVVPYWPHALQQAFLGYIPSWMRDRVVVTAMREQRKAQDEMAKKER